MLAQPPKPKPTTSTHATTNALMMNVPVQLPTNRGGGSTAFSRAVAERNVIMWASAGMM
uniref:Uncharacterized protein n=1 Tax=Arundo donax TaxID=35708 RepID=A0A0A9ES87_ARUDO